MPEQIELSQEDKDRMVKSSLDSVNLIKNMSVATQQNKDTVTRNKDHLEILITRGISTPEIVSGIAAAKVFLALPTV